MIDYDIKGAVGARQCSARATVYGEVRASLVTSNRDEDVTYSGSRGWQSIGWRGKV